MKRKVHWRVLSMLIAICMTMQLLPVIAVHAASHEYFYYGTGLNKAADGEPASIDPASEILIDGGSVSFTDAAQITWKANGLEEPEAPKDEFQYYSVVVSETIDGEDYETEIYFVIYAEHEHEFGDTYEHEYGHELVCNYCAAHINELHSYGEWQYAAGSDMYTRTCSVCGHISEGKKVTYDYGQNGGTSSTVEFEIVEEGAPADLTPTAERDGYDFVGWTTNQYGETPDTGVYVQNNITLYAIFSKTRDVNFYSQDNKLQKTFTATMYNNNKYASVEADLGLGEGSAYYPADYDGWEVDGWTSSTEANDEVTTSEMIYSNGKLFIPDATVDYYGFYLRDYTLEYDVNSYSDIAAAPDPTWIFQYYNSSGNESSAEAVIASAVVPSSLDYKWVIDGKFYSPGEKITLTTAVEEAKFVLASDIKTVTYDYAANGGTSATASTKQVISGAEADLTPTAVKDGYEFVGWSRYADSRDVLSEYDVTGDTTLYAVFKKTVSVSFESELSYQDIEADIYNNDSSAYVAAVPTPGPCEGYTAVGWKDSSSPTEGTVDFHSPDGAVYIPDVNKRYYALYSRELTLTYDTTGHYSNNTQTGTQYHNAAGNTSSVSLTVNAPATTTVDPDFMYWTDADGNIYDPSDTINIIEDTTLYASWRSEQNYAVTYDYATNGGTSVDGEAKRLVKYGGAADLTPAAVKADSEFIGWNTDRNAHEALDTYTVTGDITLYAIFARTETVRFYSQPGRIQAMLRAYCFNNESDYYIEGVPAPAVPAGWTALGWTTSTEASQKTELGASEKQQIVSDPEKDLYAVGSRTIAIHYETDGRYDMFSPSETQYYNGSGETTSHTFTLASLDDEDFAAWAALSRDGQKYNGGDELTITETTSVYAVWKDKIKNYNVTYDYRTNGGTGTTAANGEVMQGAKADLSGTAEKDGYVFVGWNTDQNAHEALDEYIVEKNTVLYAIFAKEITVTYNEVSPGLSIANTGKLYNNDEYVTIEAPALAARLGWTALGWREVNGNDSVIFANGAVTTDKDITVEAVYTRNITLTYDLNGASSYVEPQTKLQTSYQTEIPFILAYPPRRADYSFAGWEINGETIEYKYNEQNTVMLTDSATAKAVWQDNRPTVEQVTVTYDYRTNGGSSISASDTRLVTKGANVDLTLTAYRDGYEFIGWNTDKDAHDALESVKADSNITLYAIYKKDVTATFYSGEYVSAENTVTVSESIWNNDRTAEVTFPQAAGYDGWSFKGWRDDRHPLEPVYTGSTVRISADKSFFAIYQREISITGDVDDQSRTQYSNTGSGTFAVAVSVGYSVAEEPEREGMRCVGYEVYEDGEKVSDCYEGETIMVSDSVSVVAKWVPIPDGATLPDVETVGASVSSYTSADLTLDVQNDDIAGNEIISQGFVYWSKNDVNSKYTVRTSDMTAALSNLSQGTEYYYYAFAENAAGIGKGTIKTFKTDSDKTPNAIMISPEYVSLEKGGVYQLLATLLPETAANREIFWSSSNESVVKVDPDGKLTGVSAGQAIITATTEVGRLTAECIVDVAERQEAVEYDFSEWHLASHMGAFGAQGYDWDAATGGGNYQMSTAYLARWDGAVLESKDKYPGFAGSAASLVHNGIGADFHVQNVEWIPKRTGDLDNDDIKSALMEYGAVYTVMNADWSCFTADNVSFYCPYTTDVNSHAITIVGWDDSYSRSNFKTTAPGDGAFICKNSWGSDWAQGGYFYISYYDKNLGRKDSNAAFTGVEGTDNYNKIYQYDPLGAVGYIGFDETTYAANVFPPSGETVANDETLKAVSFYTYQKNTTYDVYIVTDYKDQYSLGELRAPDATGTIKNSGYHTIELKTPVAIEKGTRFAVVVKYDTPGQDAYVYCEYPVGGYSSKARANADESYIGFDPYDWNDLTDWVENGNFCIKAFTDNGLAGTSSLLFSGVDNENREYENDKIYTLDEAVENGFGVSDEYSDFADDAAETAQLADAPSMSLGNVPSIARTGLNTVSFTDGAMFPTSYDLREMGVVSSVKDQGQWGTCWAHATYASLESGILKKAKTTQTDEKATEATDITLSRGEATLGSDAAITVAKKIMPLNLEDKSVTWISSDESVVTVDTNGTIRAVGDGVASIAVSTTSGGRVAQCSVVVDTGNIEKTVTLEAERLVKEIGDKFMVAYSVTPITAEDDAMTWISDNTNVAAVNENGVIEVVGEGSADVSIVSDGEIMDTVTIVSGDGFNLEPTAIDASGASLTDGVLAGAVSVNVMNNASSAKSATVALGIYGGDGRLAGTRYATQVLEPGVSTITIDDISIEGISGSYTYKCMLWNAVGDMAPMSIAISENAAEPAEE